MPRDETLVRARADLAAGATTIAVQRLRGLLGTFPLDLELREELAAAYRAQGNLVEAGRWSYLAEQRVPAEVAAFEWATRNAVRRMRLLSWPADADPAPTPVAAERLATVQRAAEAQRDARLRYSILRERERIDPSPGTTWGQRFWGALVALLIGLFLLGVANGAVTLIRWLA